YVAYGRLVFQRIEQLDAQRAEVAAVLDTAEGAGLVDVSRHPSRGSPREVWLQDEDGLHDRCGKLLGNGPNVPKNADITAHLHRACDAAEQLKSKRTAADRELASWDILPRLPVWIHASDQQGDTKVTAAELEEQEAATFLAILGNYILP